MNGLSTWWAKEKDVFATERSEKKEPDLRVSSVLEQLL